MKKLLTLLSLVTITSTANAQNSFPYSCIPTYTNSCSTIAGSSGAYAITSVKTTGGTLNINNAQAVADQCGSTGPNYHYYTGANKILQVNAGATCTLTVQASVPSSSYINRVCVWIDWNADGMWDNSTFIGPTPNEMGELINTSVSGATAPNYAQFIFKVPMLAKNGLTRMRIRSIGTHQPAASAGPNNSNAIGGAVNPCLTNGNPTGPAPNFLIVSGETEDYDVIVDNPCVTIPSITFYNTTSKGTDVKWTPKGNEQSFEYAVDLSRNDPGNGNTFLKRSVNNLHLPDDDMMKTLACNTKYYFHIRGVCDTFDGKNQALWYYSPWRLDSFVTPPCCDMPPLTISDVKSNSALASWQPVLSVQNYEYMIRINTIAPTKGIITNTTQAILPGLECSRMYYFFIRSLCSPTPTSDWKLDSFLTQPCLGIENSRSFPDFNLTVYPNPAKNIVTLSVMHGAKLADGHISVTDLTGKVIYDIIMKEDKIDIDLHEQPAGIYLLRYSDEQRTKVVKISKQ